MNKRDQVQSILAYYRQKTGKQEVDMTEVATFALQMGWSVPDPPTPVQRLAKQFAQLAREVIRYDAVTKKPYRANHAVTQGNGPDQLTLWIDIDDAPRKPMVKSLFMRREQMINDGLQLTLDADHWNSVHNDEEPIIVPMDFTDDVEWRKNSPDEIK